MKESQNLLVRVLHHIIQFLEFFIPFASCAPGKRLIVNHHIIEVDLLLPIDLDHAKVCIILERDKRVVLFELGFKVAFGNVSHGVALN